jgi:hypothetical protein
MDSNHFVSSSNSSFTSFKKPYLSNSVNLEVFKFFANNNIDYSNSLDIGEKVIIYDISSDEEDDEDDESSSSSSDSDSFIEDMDIIKDEEKIKIEEEKEEESQNNKQENNRNKNEGKESKIEGSTILSIDQHESTTMDHLIQNQDNNESNNEKN